MKIRYQTTVCGPDPDANGNAGDEKDVPQDVAVQLIKDKAAVPLEKPQPKRNAKSKGQENSEKR